MLEDDWKDDNLKIIFACTASGSGSQTGSVSAPLSISGRDDGDNGCVRVGDEAATPQIGNRCYKRLGHSGG